MASRRPDFLSRVDRVLAPLTWVVAAFAVFVLVVGPEVIGAKVDQPVTPAAATPEPNVPPADETTEPGETPAPTEPPAATEDAAAAGEAVFASAGCGGCHTLAAANATGGIGPNLDDLKPDEAAVKTVVTSGRGGMPSFSGDLSPEDIDAVAAYVSSAAGG